MEMAETSAETETIKTLVEISGEVDESQIRAVFSAKSIKLKTALIYKTGKEVKHCKEACHIINDANIKLKFEISHSQKVLQWMLKVQETTKTANIDIGKEYLITKHNKMMIAEKNRVSEQDYEERWLDSKAKYENVPYVKKYVKAKEDVNNLKAKIAEFDTMERTLRDEIKNKTLFCWNLVRKRVIELADYMVNERPKIIALIKEKMVDTQNIRNELKKIEEEKKMKEVTRDDEKQTAQKQVEQMDEDDWVFKLPKLQLDLDFEDSFKQKLDKMNKTLDVLNTNSKETLRTFPEETKTVDEEDYSPYFIKPNIFKENKTENYAMRKLVNIIEDVKIDTCSAQTIINKVNPESLCLVDKISANDKKAQVENYKQTESEKPEDIEMPMASNTDTLIIPPTQFMDMSFTVVTGDKQKEPELASASQQHKDNINISQPHKSSQEYYKKRVSFEVPDKLAAKEDVDMPEKLGKKDLNETFDSQINLSAVSDDGLAKIKDMLMKKHNLDLSPQFVYAKNVMTSNMNLHKSDEGATSKFFYHEPNSQELKKTDKMEVMISDEMHIDVENNPNSKKDKDHVTNPTIQNFNEAKQPMQAFSGYNLLSHSTQYVSEPNASMISTMDYDEGDANFPLCLDSSLLMSPKADYSNTEVCDKPEKLATQEAPNFLSGLRKTGLGFFGSSPADAQTDSAQNQRASGFAFNFGGEEKKTRGGLFNMFQ